MSDNRLPTSEARELAAVAAALSLLTIVLTYPQVRLLGSAVGSHYDALFSIWRIGWIAHALRHSPTHLFDANIFYPERRTLAYSDALLLPALIALPAAWARLNQIVVYNLLVLASFVACGTAMYALAKHLTGSAIAAGIAALVFAFQPYRFAHYPQLELLWSWPIPVALLALHRLVERRRVRDAVMLGAAVVCQAWSSLYYFVFLLTGLAVLAVGLLIGRRGAAIRPLVAPTAIAALIVLACVGPYAAEYRASASSLGLRRTQDVAVWSPSLASYTLTPPTNWLHGSRYGGEDLEKLLFPGATAIALAVIGLWPPVDRRRLAYLAMGAIAFEISLGTNGLTRGWVFRHLLPYEGLRVPGRMAVMVSTVVAVLAAYGVARIVRRRPSWRHAMALAFALAVILESVSIPVKLMAVEPTLPHIYARLAGEHDSPVMDWPLPHADSLGLTRAPWYMYESTAHWQPLVEGYSGFYPLSYIHLLEAMESFPSASAVEYLRGEGVKFVVLHSEPDAVAYVAMRNAVSASGAFELVADEHVKSGELALYRLRPAR